MILPVEGCRAWRALVCCLLAWCCGVEADAAERVVVRVGTAHASPDGGFFIADRRGYFRDEGIDIAFVPFNSAAGMVAPLATGQLDVGGGALSAGLFNAIARGVEIRIVADKGSTPPGYGYQPLMVATDLVRSGRFKSLADLEGLKVASSAPGSGGVVVLDAALRQGGLTLSDIERVYLGFPQQVVALANKVIDAAFTAEPSATLAVRQGVARRFVGDDVIYPDRQVAVVFYAGAFARTRAEIARRFMKAYVRALRDYNDALAGGRLAGPGATGIIDVLVEYTDIKDPAVFAEITPHGVDPDGWINEASLRRDAAFHLASGDVRSKVDLEAVLDRSFVDWAVGELGPYRRAR